jgi:hypothetical protein
MDISAEQSCAGRSFDISRRDIALYSHRWFQDESCSLLPEPTAVGAVSSAVAVHVTSRRWLIYVTQYDTLNH